MDSYRRRCRKRSDKLKGHKRTYEQIEKSKRFGSEHHSAKKKEHYETFSTQRQAFRKICKIQGWIYEEFKEIYSDFEKEYFYFYNPNEENKPLKCRKRKTKSEDFYSENPVRRSCFKSWCLNNNFSLDDFNEHDTGLKSNSGHSLFFYIRKK